MSALLDLLARRLGYVPAERLARYRAWYARSLENTASARESVRRAEARAASARAELRRMGELASLGRARRMGAVERDFDGSARADYALRPPAFPL